LIIYGLVTDESIPRLFLAGIVPGLLLGTLLMAVTFVIAYRNGYGGTGEKFKFGPLAWALREGKWAMGAPVFMLGGIYAGFFTPSEAAAAADFYGLFIGLFIYKGLTWSGVYASLRFTALIIGSILFILGSTKAFGQLVTIFDIPDMVSAGFAGFIDRPWLVMLLIGIAYILIGMWLESIPQIIIFTAVMLPLAKQIGVDPIVFGVFTVMCCEVGFLTPPIGVNLFVASKLSKTSVEKISVAVIPLLAPYIFIIVLLAFWGDWVTWLPDLVMGPTLK
jgi:C4-dicarboxylate transporter DctM subunit